ncbi:hypothetical protein [Evansella halocellulosilytica]|uniref:hypothetical protein n=1 Tax=Evansella halocellulosilytica TaxID=2011013 RepID=UPI0015CD368D|nr:hypothetical protein [Evansella halocellulosilytica]
MKTILAICGSHRKVKQLMADVPFFDKKNRKHTERIHPRDKHPNIFIRNIYRL